MAPGHKDYDKAKSAHTLKATFNTRQARESTLSKILTELDSKNISYLNGRDFTEPLPPFSDTLVELQKITRPLEEQYELYAQVYSVKPRTLEEINPDLKKTLELNGMKYLG